MAEGEAGVALLLYNDADGIAEEIALTGEAGTAQALQKYGGLVHDVLIDLCGSKEFAHVEFLELDSSYKSGDVTSPLAVVVGEPLKSEDGQLIGVANVQHVLDIFGALSAAQPLPSIIADRVGVDEDGMLGFTDDEANKLSSKWSKQLKLEERFPEAISQDEEEAIADVMGRQIPEGSELEPVHPEDLLHTLPVFLALAAGAPQRQRRPKSDTNIIKQGQQLLGQAVHVPLSLLRNFGKRTRMLRQNVWRVEDFAVLTAKAAVKIARKAIRPLLVGYVLHRALTTLDNSRSLPMRMSRLPRKQAIDLYYRELLGEDYGEQMEQDLLDAVAEVEAGLITDDYVEEKRLLSAAMLRRLEVEEWDKERMKNFYLGSYGMGPWYFDMEDRLHNAYFMGARAWNGPIEGWVNKNKVYSNDLPLEANSDAYALAAIENSLGRTLTPAQKGRVLAARQPRAVDLLTAKGGLLEGVVDQRTVQEHLEAQP